MTHKHRQPWSDQEDLQLHRTVGYVSIRWLAAEMGRTPAAIKQRMLEVGVRQHTPEKIPDYLTAGQFAEAMGLTRPAARRLLVASPFCQELYRGNQRTYMAVWSELCRWLANPLNWLELDETKIVHPELCQIVADAKADNGRDCWLTIEEGAEQFHYSYWTIHKWIYRRKILPTTRGQRGRKGNPLHLIKKSDLERVIKEREGE